MRQILIFIFLSLLVFSGRTQSSSLDSLRMVLPIGNETVISSIQYSKNGKWILTTSWDNTARIYESASGKELKILKNCQFGKTVFSPDGKLVLTAGSNARILDVFSGNELHLLATKFDEVDHYDHVLFSHGGNLALTAEETAVRIYDVTTGKCLQSLNGHSVGVDFCIFNRDDSKVLIASKDKKVRIWNINSGELISIIDGIIPRVEFANFSPDDSKVVLFTFNDKKVRICDAISGRILTTLDDRQFENVNFSNDESKLLTVSDDDIVRIWDVQSGNLLIALEGHTDHVNSATFSSDDTKVITASEDNTARIWDTASGKLINTLEGHTKKVHFATFSPDDSKIVTASRDNTVRIWDAITGLQLNTIERLGGGGAKVISPSGESLLLTENEENILIYNLRTGEQLHNLKGHAEWVSSVSFGSNDNELLTLSKDNNLRLWDLEYGVLLEKLERPTDNTFIYKVYFQDDLKKITSTNSTIEDFNTGIDLFEIDGYPNYTTSATFSSDDKKILVASDDYKARIYDLTSGNLLHTLNGHSDLINSTSFSADFSKVLTNGADHKTILWDVETGKAIYIRLQLERDNYLVKLPNSPYYMCSKDASKMLHYVTPSLKVIGFEQLDPVYNRPDIVLDSIGKYFGGADQELVANYRQSWEKRIDRLGLDKEKLGKGEIAVPNADIVGADDIAYENKEGQLNVKVSANDSKYPLRRFNVYVNEVPLYGSAGISIAHLKKQVWDTTVSVPLSIGENKIQVSVMNELGLENFKYPTYVNYTPSKELSAKTYYIGIGVNEFKESSHNLKYCVKDVRDLAIAFSKENTNCDTLLFTDKQVTKENILALKTYLNKTTVNDKVIISCSSHGLLDDSLNFYLAMHDVDFNNPQARGLKYEELESLLDSIPARQKLLLLDACNSGENDKTEVLKQELQQKEKSMDSTELLAARSVIIKLEEENKSNFKKMNELFVNVRNNTGSVIISAAGGQESALEAIQVDGKTIENGAFTYSILECLKQNEGKELKVNTLKQYAEKRVEEITNGKQKPTSRQETMEVDWGVR